MNVSIPCHCRCSSKRSTTTCQKYYTRDPDTRQGLRLYGLEDPSGFATPCVKRRRESILNLTEGTDCVCLN